MPYFFYLLFYQAVNIFFLESDDSTKCSSHSSPL
ncbi:Hypothetical protein DIP0366 [Corynebacterium diphtheriae]|uniref:Uncharacterized protein n=1 Tax=Corynebacterium diphtheriae (strain ATCC 700971 / NCTC 13129 / Biotype gravis) TaxID=257309 RepID=Q6NJN2_CORDI|nr:Hypothetical protein DIP0366 [Corynebacterium diphtheriae]